MGIKQNFRKIVLFLLVNALWSTSFAAEKPPRTVYDYSLVDLTGKEVSLSAYKGKVLVIVNLASQSIFHEQNAMLEELQKTYAEQGLIVLGVPSNDFGAQEPGTDADIEKVYGKDLHLTFPVFARVSIRGKDQAPLYYFLTGDKKTPTDGDVPLELYEIRCGSDRQGGRAIRAAHSADCTRSTRHDRRCARWEVQAPGSQGGGTEEFSQ